MTQEPRAHRLSEGSCLVCGEIAVEEFLDLGETALANKFLTDAELEQPERRFPLRVGFCQECGHVQLTEHVPPGLLFSDYLYTSSASDTLREHFADLGTVLVGRLDLGPADLVVDIGCNDALFLGELRKLGVRTLGVDPAENLSELAKDLGIDRYTGFFNAASAKTIVETRGRAALITATNTFPHIPELDDFLEGVCTVLAPGGTFVIECHYLVDMLDQVAFDTIYHEHVSYWALGPMTRLLSRHGLQVVHAERLPLHHGQLRVSIQRTEDGGTVDPSVGEILAMERDLRLHEITPYEAFADQTRRIKSDLLKLLGELKNAGEHVAAYGAPAKGSTLLEYLELGPAVIDWIADKSPLKQGRSTPGSHIPVVDPARIVAENPSHLLLLAWNFVDEVLEQQADYRALGGKFIIPVPEVRLI